MKDTLLSIIIPTYNRPQLLLRAVNSALAQTIEDFEVIVVDDCSDKPVNLPEHPRLRIIELAENKGVSAARNIGAKAAKGRYINYLDDDDELLPHMAQVSLAAIENTKLPQPVGVLSAIEVISKEGKVIQTRIPPTLPRGSHFGLEQIAPFQSFLSKQTLVIEKEVFLAVGGFDESFTSRETTELFLRLNPVCSILGIPQITYRLIKHQGFQLSSDSTQRQTSFDRLVKKHQKTFQAYPKGFADLIYNEVVKSYQLGLKQVALKNLVWAMKVNPVHTLGRLFYTVKNSVTK